MNKVFLTLLLIGTAVALSAQSTPLKEGSLYKKAILKQGAKITNSPGGGKVMVRLKPMDIVYIYEEKNSRGFYKVGTDVKGALGYLPAKNLQLWNNRICVHFASIAGRDPALVFQNPTPLRSCLNGVEDFYSSGKTPHPKSIAQEPDDVKSADRFAMLMPVLERQRIRGGKGSNNLYQVGFLAGGDGPLVDEDSDAVRPSGGSNIAQLEIMFLLDATASMQPYIDATKEVIQEVTDRITRTREGGVRFGISAYRDYVDAQDDMEFITRQFSDLTGNVSNVIRTLNRVYEAKTDSEDFAEAVFDGYFAALTETGWKDAGNTLRLIILIGDASGHQPGSVKNPMNLNPDVLLKKASEKRVRTVAVKIKSGRDDDDRLGKSQFYEIAEGSTIADKGSFIEVNYPDNASDVADFVDKTSAKIEAEIERLQKMIGVIKKTKARPSSTPRFSSDISATDRAIILKNIKIETGSTGAFAFSTGWLNEYDADGRKILDAYIYMTKNEYDLMKTYIKLVNQVVENPDLALGGSMKEVVESLTGETLEGMDLGKHYKKATGLPIKSDILKIPPDEISTWGEERKRKMIELINGKLNNIEIWGNNLDNWNKSPGSKGGKYTFIPIDMLP